MSSDQLLRARVTRARGAAAADVAVPFVAVLLEAAGAFAAGTRGGVSLYLDAFAVARTVSGLIRLGAPRSLRRRLSARRSRSFCVTAPLAAAALSHFASSSAIRTDFGVKVVSGIESLCDGRGGGGSGG